MKFKYDAMNQSGQEVQDTIVAKDSESALAYLRNSGLFPTRIRPVDGFGVVIASTGLPKLSKLVADFKKGYRESGKRKRSQIVRPVEGNYWGISFPRIFGWFWGQWLCRRGYHLFHETHREIGAIGTVEQHYLSCDCCEMELHIDRVTFAGRTLDEVG